MCVYKTFKGGYGRIFDMWQGDLLLIQMTILIIIAIVHVVRHWNK